MSFPPAGTRYNGNGGDDAASASAKIPSKKCVRPERPRCEPEANEFRTESGACVCKLGYVRSEQGQCVRLIGPPLCPDGKPVPKSGHCPAVPPKCEPGPNEERNAEGQCVCKEGFERDRRGRCVKPRNPADECEERGGHWNAAHEICMMPPTPAEECEKKGWTWDRDRERCLPPPSREDECKKKGWNWDPDRERCLPPAPEPCTGGKVRVDGRCVCPGDTVEKQGRCVPTEVIPAVAECTGGAIRNGKCICPDGFEPRQTGPNAFRCVATLTCRGGTVRDGKCACPTGQEVRQVGANAFRCTPRKIPKLPRPLCPKGSSWNEQYKKCLPVLQ